LENYQKLQGEYLCQEEEFEFPDMDFASGI